MDVRKKFTLNMTGLVIIVVILSVLVYLSATRTPFQGQEEVADEAPTLFDPAALPESDGEPQEAEGFRDTATAPAPEDSADTQAPLKEDTVTIKLSDNEPPEKQLEYPSVVGLQNVEAVYTLHLRASWSKRLHPHWFPQGAHLSPMAAWSHRLMNSLFRSGHIASDGMELMAETGGTTELVKEIKTGIATGAIFDYSIGSVFNAPGEDAVQLSVSEDVPYVTVVSMIAPSPDWFIAARNVALQENGRWLDRKTVSAVLYDAGTDSGLTFTAADDDTDPPQPITKLRNSPPLPIATFEFIKK